MSVSPSIWKSEEVKQRAWRPQGLLPSEVPLAYDSLRQLRSCEWSRCPGQMTSWPEYKLSWIGVNIIIFALHVLCANKSLICWSCTFSMLPEYSPMKLMIVEYGRFLPCGRNWAQNLCVLASNELPQFRIWSVLVGSTLEVLFVSFIYSCCITHAGIRLHTIYSYSWPRRMCGFVWVYV